MNTRTPVEDFEFFIAHSRNNKSLDSNTKNILWKAYVAGLNSILSKEGLWFNINSLTWHFIDEVEMLSEPYPNYLEAKQAYHHYQP